MITCRSLAVLVLVVIVAAVEAPARAIQAFEAAEAEDAPLTEAELILADLGLTKYSAIFRHEEIVSRLDFSVLDSRDELKEIGITALGPQKRILRRAARLRATLFPEEEEARVEAAGGLVRAGHRRRASTAAAPGIGGASIHIKAPSGKIAFGPQGDVAFYRADAGVLATNARLVADGGLRVGAATGCDADLGGLLPVMILQRAFVD